MGDDGLLAWVSLSLLPGMSGRRLRALQAAFPHDLAAVFGAPAGTLRAIPGVGAQTAAAIRAVNLREAAARLARWQAEGVEVVTVEHPLYPDALKLKPHPPPTLFVRGSLENCAGGVFMPTPGVALVGSRDASAEGKAGARRLALATVARGWTVISGLAVGIDAAAHEGALAGGGYTLAVLGSGILKVYPLHHDRLAAQIVAGGGALMCEVAPDAPPSARMLVARNRLIAWLSRLVIVVETRQDGGAMHAARFAQAEGVPVRFGSDESID